MYPKKWRETMNPFNLNFQQFQLVEVLGYPHAGNDVFVVKGIYKIEEVIAYLKVERQQGANIEREIRCIEALADCLVPTILEYSLSSPRYLLTREANGERLSVILLENEQLQSLPYLKHYGETLACLHQKCGIIEPVKERKFFYISNKEFFETYDLLAVYHYLMTHIPTEKTRCFVHGDFHYANLLWKEKQISCILDFELSGRGVKEFDIAWTLILRPSQRFLKTKQEMDQFLEGYRVVGTYNHETLIYYMVLIYCYFYESGIKSKDEAYCKFIQQFWHQVCS